MVVFWFNCVFTNRCAGCRFESQLRSPVCRELVQKPAGWISSGAPGWTPTWIMTNRVTESGRDPRCDLQFLQRNQICNIFLNSTIFLASFKLHLEGLTLLKQRFSFILKRSIRKVQVHQSGGSVLAPCSLTRSGFGWGRGTLGLTLKGGFGWGLPQHTACNCGLVDWEKGGPVTSQFQPFKQNLRVIFSSANKRSFFGTFCFQTPWPQLS